MSEPGEVFTPGSVPGQALSAGAATARCVVISGIPGVGKSLFVREQALMARGLGRTVHSIEWDVSRLAFEQPGVLDRYPEIDDVTHPVIRRAAGLWARQAIGRWSEAHAHDHDFLVIEAPLIGGRFAGLARVEDDAAEPLLASEATRFLVPQPSTAVRNRIEALRSREINQNRHALDAKDAPPALVDALWLELVRAADALGIARERGDDRYSAQLYLAVYERLLRHRWVVPVPVTEVIEAQGSTHALEGVVTRIVPEAGEALALLDAVERGGVEAAARYTQDWYRV